MNTRKLSLIFFLLFFVHLNLFAWTSSNEGVCYTMDTLVSLSDSISYNEIDEMFEVDCDIVILENDTLKINPGEYLFFIEVNQPPYTWEYYGIKIFGTLHAIGEPNKLVYLGDKEYNISTGNIWCGIQFYNTSHNGESIIKYCRITGAINVLGYDFTFDGDVGIYCENSSPIIDHCLINYMLSDYETGGGSAIACRGQSYPIISYCEFEHLYNSIAIWCNPWDYAPDTINYPSPLIFGCNILPSVTGFYFTPVWDDVIIFRGGFLDNCYLGINNLNNADTTLGIPVDSIGDGICTTTSTYWEKRFMDVDGVVNPRGDTLFTGINEEENEILPTTSKYLELNNNYPNPFSNYTSIEFEIFKKNSEVSLMVYDSKGNQVKILFQNRKYPIGKQSVKWYGDDENGNEVSEGIYFYKLLAENSLKVKKAIIIK